MRTWGRRSTVAKAYDMRLLTPYPVAYFDAGMSGETVLGLNKTPIPPGATPSYWVDRATGTIKGLQPGLVYTASGGGSLVAGGQSFTSYTAAGPPLLNVTISAWVKSYNIGSPQYQRFVTVGNEGMVLRLDTGGLRAYCTVTQGLILSTIWPVMIANTRAHVASTWDGTSLKVYHNGVLLETITPGTGTLICSRSLLLGGSNPEYMNGDMSHVAVYSTAATAAEIANYFTKYRGFYGV